MDREANRTESNVVIAPDAIPIRTTKLMSCLHPRGEFVQFRWIRGARGEKSDDGAHTRYGRIKFPNKSNRTGVSKLVV